MGEWRTRYSDELLDRALELRNTKDKRGRKMPWSAVEAALGIKGGNLTSMLAHRKAGRWQGGSGRRDAESIEIAREIVQDRKTVKEVAHTHGVSESAIVQRLNRLGLTKGVRAKLRGS